MTKTLVQKTEEDARKYVKRGVSVKRSRCQKALTNTDLKELAKRTNMTDLYLTAQNEVFTVSTEEKAIGMNFFDIWMGIDNCFRMIR